jgi:hypothetical protein
LSLTGLCYMQCLHFNISSLPFTKLSSIKKTVFHSCKNCRCLFYFPISYLSPSLTLTLLLRHPPFTTDRNPIPPFSPFFSFAPTHRPLTLPFPGIFCSLPSRSVGLPRAHLSRLRGLLQPR